MNTTRSSVNIEWRNDGWYICFLDNQTDCWKGPFWTFQEAYDMFDLLNLQPN